MPTKQPIHHGKRIHIKCRRCGRRAYHLRNKACSACGYGKTSKMRGYNWGTKGVTRTQRLH